MDAVTQMIFIIATLLLLGALGEFIFSRTGIPDLIWLVATGIVAGPVFNIILLFTLGFSLVRRMDRKSTN